MPHRQRKTANLRAGRVTVAGGRYFITACTCRRQPVFACAPVAAAASASIERLSSDGDVAWLVATVMPDYLHLLFELTNRLTLTQVIAKTKSPITRVLKRSAGLWQENVFEHRLRVDEDTAAYAFYIFMNPYRAGLVPITTPFSNWICSAQKIFRFLDGLDSNGAPPTEWLDRDETFNGTLKTGE